MTSTARTSIPSSRSTRTPSRRPTGSTPHSGVRSRRPAARHSDPGQGRDRHRRHADDARHRGVQGLPAAETRSRSSKLRKAGAIILGKTTLSEFAAGDTYGSMFGVTRNPYDLERTVGGSSGGSGAALAANFSTVTHRRGNARLDPPAGRLECGRQPAADARPRQPQRHVGRLSDRARADGPDGAHRARPRDPARRHGRLRSGGSGDRARHRQDRRELHAIPGRELPSTARGSASCANRSGQNSTRIRRTSRRSMPPSRRTSRN